MSDLTKTHLVVDLLFGTVRCAVHQTLGMSPGSIVFGRDMFLPIPVIANLQALQQKRQLRVDQNLLKSNMRCKFHDCQVGD